MKKIIEGREKPEDIPYEVTGCHLIWQTILYPRKVIYTSLIIDENEPHCEAVVRVLAKHFRNQRALANGMSVEMSDSMKSQVQKMLNSDTSLSAFDKLAAMGVTMDQLKSLSENSCILLS